MTAAQKTDPWQVTIEWQDAQMYGSKTLSLSGAALDYWAKPMVIRTTGWLIHETADGYLVCQDLNRDARGGLLRAGGRLHTKKRLGETDLAHARQDREGGVSGVICWNGIAALGTDPRVVICYAPWEVAVQVIVGALLGLALMAPVFWALARSEKKQAGGS